MTEIAIIGGGVAGLTAAQELGERGYIVHLYEQLGAVGGKTRSFARTGQDLGGSK